MKISSAYVQLEHLKFYSYHGVLPQENIVGGSYTVDITIKYDTSLEQLKEDNLCNTINYASVYESIKNEMSKPKKLLETVATAISERLYHEHPSIENIDVAISKDNPPMGANCKSASFRLLTTK